LFKENAYFFQSFQLLNSCQTCCDTWPSSYSSL